VHHGLEEFYRREVWVIAGMSHGSSLPYGRACGRGGQRAPGLDRPPCLVRGVVR
jgi:hypothetical protein